jgi:hypothetical protein
MALKKDRTRTSVRGLGDIEVRQTEPSAAAAFDNVGYLDGAGTDIVDEVTMEEINDEGGNLINVLEKSQKVTLATLLSQTSIDEVNLIKGAKGKVFAMRYFGRPSPSRFQYFCFEQIRINPSTVLKYNSEKRTLPLRAWSIKQDYTLVDIPVYYMAETMGEIRIKDLALWVNPRLAINAGTANILDISGFARHGVATAGFATMWGTAGFLRFGGATDAVDFGNVLNDDGTSDFMIETWVRVQGADGTLQEVAAKKDATANSAGFALYRSAANKMQFILGSGTANASLSSTGTVMQNVWKHVAVAVDRNGSATIYINGVADGNLSVASIGTGTNALSLFLGRDNTNFGQVDIDAVRVYSFGAGNLPADIASIISKHFTAERGYYGV